jgi:hypothetical protein
VRIECPACKEVVTAALAIDGGSVRATCPACQITTTEQVATRPPAHAIEHPDPLAACPKCGAARTAGAACPRCGLATDKFAEFSSARDATIGEDVRAAWQKLLDAWDIQASHDALLSLVTRDGCLPWAAAKYREVARSRPDDPIAPRELARLGRAAEVALLATATERPDKAKSPYPASTVMLLILVTVLAIGAVVGVFLLRGGHPSEPPPIPTSR